MSYTKQTWANGDTITAEKLNHMEDGIAASGGGGGGGAALIVNASVSLDAETMSFVVDTIDKTYADVTNAYSSGGIVIANVTLLGRVQQIPLTTIDEPNNLVRFYLAAPNIDGATLTISSISGMQLEMASNGENSFEYGEVTF